MANFDDLVYGERLGDLMPVLRSLADSRRITEDGMCELSAEFEPNLAVPFFRALLRAEAELLLEDAAVLTTCEYSQKRTNDQRSVDALVRIAKAMGALP